MKKYVLKFGLIAGGIMSVMMLLTMPFMDTIGMDNGEVIGYSTMLVAFLMVYFGVRAYRDNVLGGRIGFGKALKAGLLITCISSLCYVATWEVLYFGGLKGDFVKQYTEHSLAKARAAGKSEAEIEIERKKMEEFQAMYENPLINSAITFLEPLPMGLLMTLISAGLLSRTRRSPNAGGSFATHT